MVNASKIEPPRWEKSQTSITKQTKFAALISDNIGNVWELFMAFGLPHYSGFTTNNYFWGCSHTGFWGLFQS